MWEQGPRPRPACAHGTTCSYRLKSRACGLTCWLGWLLAEVSGDLEALFLPKTAHLTFFNPSTSVVALLGVKRKCLSHAVTLAEELVFVLFLISALSLDLRCFCTGNLSYS